MMGVLSLLHLESVFQPDRREQQMQFKNQRVVWACVVGAIAWAAMPPASYGQRQNKGKIERTQVRSATVQQADLLRSVVNSTVIAAASVSTDQTDYAPGDTVNITGAGFAGGETVSVVVKHDDVTVTGGEGHNPWDVVADEFGGFVTSWKVPYDDNVGQTLDVKATGGSSGSVATTSFTDANLGTATAVVTGSTATPTHNCGGKEDYNVRPGDALTVTLSGIECTDGSTITVDLSGTWGTISGGNSFSGTVSGGSFSFSFTVPANACHTTPIKYSCGGTDYFARASTILCPGIGSKQVHIRAFNADGTEKTNCTGCDDCGGGSCCHKDATCSAVANAAACDFVYNGDGISCNDVACEPEGCDPFPCPDDTTLACNASIPACDPPTCSVDCDGSCADATLISACSTSVSRKQTCTNTINPLETSSCTQVITVPTDTTAPTFDNLPTGGDLGCNPTPPACANVTATDACDGTLNATCSPGAVGANGCDRSQTFTYSVTDGCGNSASSDVSYTWTEDTSAPTFDNLPTGGDLGCNPKPPTCQAVTASDDCDGTLNASCSPGAVVANGCNRSQTFTYSVTDGCGNSASSDVTYTWTEDTTPPVFTACPVDFTVQLTLKSDGCDTVVEYDVAADDNCGPPTLDCGLHPSGSVFPLGMTSVSCKATDGCGNSSECNFIVTVLSFINVKKFYDANADGVDNDNQVVKKWPVLCPGGATTTGDDGKVQCSGLGPGSYTVSEGTQTNWVNTTDTKCQATLPPCPGNCTFGNFCFGKGGGLTLGFWSNKNGQAVMNDGGTMAPELALLSGLNLKNAGPCPGAGSDFNPATYAAFKAWLLKATATNMAYMLSAQLAAMEMNVEAGFVAGGNAVCLAGGGGGGLLVSAPGCGNTGFGNNYISVCDLIKAANDALGAAGGGCTVDAGAARTNEECLKSALDRANNNLNVFVQPGPCPF